MQEDPDNWNLQEQLGASLINQTVFHLTESEPKRGLEVADEASEIFQRLALVHPQVPNYLQGWSYAVSRRAIFLDMLGQSAVAAEAMQTAVELSQRLVDQHPEVVSYKKKLATSHFNLGTMCARLGDDEAAQTSLLAGKRITEALADQIPHDFEIRLGLANAETELGTLAFTRQDDEQALEYSNSAIKRLITLQREIPENVKLRHDLCAAASNRANAFQRLQRYEEALVDRQSAIDHGSAAMRATLCFRLAVTQAEAGSPQLALETIENARASMDDTPDNWAHLGQSLTTVGKLSQDQQVFESAVHALQTAHDQGYFNRPDHVHWLRESPEFAALSGRTDFQRLLDAVNQTDPNQTSPSSGDRALTR